MAYGLCGANGSMRLSLASTGHNVIGPPMQSVIALQA